MRFAAIILLVAAFALDLLAGAGCLVLGLKGAGALEEMLSRASGIAGPYAGLVQSEVQRAAAGLMALEGRHDPLAAGLPALRLPFEHALAAAGGLAMLAGLLAMVAALCLLGRRGAAMAYLGSAAAIAADAAPLALLGFSFFQLPGLAGGLLGLVAARGMTADATPLAIATKPAAKPRSQAERDTAEDTGSRSKIRPTVRTADDFRPDPGRTPRPRARTLAFASAAAVLVIAGAAGYLAYLEYFAGDAAAPAPRAAAPAPQPSDRVALVTPPPAPEAPPEPKISAIDTSGPVSGALDGRPFAPDRAALKVAVAWTAGGAQSAGAPRNVDRLSLVLDAGEDLHIEIAELPRGYDFARGLTLRVDESTAKITKPTLTITTPQRSGAFPKTEVVQDDYELELVLEPLRRNRVSGRIALLLPEPMQTRFGGRFSAWVDGHPEIEPDLTRGGRPTFRYIAFQYLKEIHPGAAITIEDDSYAHQVGDASRLLAGHMMLAYTVDGEESAAMLRMETSEGYWRVLDSLDATYLAEAHPIDIPDPKNEGQWVNYLAARHTEQWFREEYPGKYPWSVRITGTSDPEVGYADIRLRLEPYGMPEVIERRYYFLRTDGRWRYIRDLAEDERIDQTTGKVAANS